MSSAPGWGEPDQEGPGSRLGWDSPTKPPAVPSSRGFCRNSPAKLGVNVPVDSAGGGPTHPRINRFSACAVLCCPERGRAGSAAVFWKDFILGKNKI